MLDANFYLEIINHLSDGVYFVDTTRTIRFWNRAAEKITGYTAAEIVGKPCQESMLNHVDVEGCPLCLVGCPLFKTIQDGEKRIDQVLVQHKEGYRVPINVTIFPMWDAGKIIGAVEIFSLNSPTVYEDSFIETLSNVAMHDALTQLPNRRYMESFLEYKLHEVIRFQQDVAVLFADVDDFRFFNNTYGHEAGDAVLRNVSSSLLHNIRKNDLIARWGGEEFVGAYTINDPAHAAVVAEKFRTLVENTTVVIGGRPLHTTVSVGVTLLRGEDTIESVVSRADALMYQSKRAGKNRVTMG